MVTLLLALFLLPALADEAFDITGECSFFRAGNRQKTTAAKMTDQNYNTYAEFAARQSFEIDAGGFDIGALYLSFYDRPVPLYVEGLVDGVWVKSEEGGQFLQEYLTLPEGSTRARVTSLSRSRLWIAEIRVFTPGDRPKDCAQWHIGGKADLMLVSCHPDDELLWFGGLLPTYAGERKLEVQNVIAVPSTPIRKQELLNALWHCGVTRYPFYMDLSDTRADTMSNQYWRWGYLVVPRLIAEAVRRYQPDVVVTHATDGEYGHPGHRVVADAVLQAVPEAAAEDKWTESAERYGTWQVQKLYLHKWPENQIHLDWHVPLKAFGGKDSFDVAKEAFRFHKSQISGGWMMEEGGEQDNAFFGLVFSMVGEDERGDDFMENILPDSYLVTEDAEEGYDEETDELEAPKVNLPVRQVPQNP